MGDGEPVIMDSGITESGITEDLRRLNILNDSENYMIVISYQKGLTSSAISGSSGNFHNCTSIYCESPVH